METEPVGDNFLELVVKVCDRVFEVEDLRTDEVELNERVLEADRRLLVLEAPLLPEERAEGYLPAFLLAMEYFFELS